MNNVAFYQPDQHNEMIRNWYEAWGMEFDPSIMPATGIVMENVCAIFMYETNSKVCFLEGYISNPIIDKKVRDECLDHIADKMIKVAKDKGYEYAFIYSRHEVVAKRAIKHGFSVSDHMYYCIGRSL